MMFSANHWCVFATADAHPINVARDPRRSEMFMFEFGLDRQRDGEPVQVPAPAPPIDGPTAMHN
jgi:hypothetical protein